MKRWMIPAFGSAVLVGAAVIGMAVFASGGGDGSCDSAALRAAVRDGIGAMPADEPQFAVSLPDGCGDDDLTMAVLETTRDWHAMPGGIVMREGEHRD